MRALYLTLSDCMAWEVALGTNDRKGREREHKRQAGRGSLCQKWLNIYQKTHAFSEFFGLTRY